MRRTTDRREHSPRRFRAGRVRAGAGRRKRPRVPPRSYDDCSKWRAGGSHPSPCVWGRPRRGHANWSYTHCWRGGSSSWRSSRARYSARSPSSADAKKNGMTRRKIQYWVIPPQADLHRVRARTWNRSWICTSETPTITRLSRRVHGRAAADAVALNRTQPPLPMAATKLPSEGVSTHEYERARHGDAVLRPVQRAAGKVLAAVPDRPGTGVRRVDWALEVAAPLGPGRYRRTCPKIHLGTATTSTRHTKGRQGLAKWLEPARARELVRRIEFCHTPKHGELAEPSRRTN